METQIGGQDIEKIKCVPGPWSEATGFGQGC